MVIEQDKYIAVTKQRILCLKGWILKSRLNANQVKLFASPSQVKQFLETQRSYVSIKYEIKKVKVRIEVIEDES